MMAQGKVEGHLYSSSTKEKIGGATISLVTTKDSTKRLSLLTDSLGHFSFNNVLPGNYFLLVSVLSFESVKKSIRLLPSKNRILLDSVFVTPSYDALESVTVVAKKATVIVKTDTMTFNASSFRVRQNGTVEDLFKKIPGMEVDNSSGAVKAQGETITQIYVDGKPFFGTDIKAVTQNFPAEVIDKIEIIDKKSDQALATHVEDGIREKIINVTLKKNSRRGLFGRDYLSEGTAGRYEGKLNTNIFNNDRKIAIVAGANNTGRNDNNNSGSDDASYNNWNGINDNKQLKINYADKYGKTFDFSSWAGYERNKTVKAQQIDRQYIYTDSSTYYTEKNSSTSINNNTYAGLYFEYRPDTLTFIRFNQNANYADNKNNSAVVSHTDLANGDLLNNGNTNNDNTATTPSLNGQVSMSHRFNRSRRSIFINFSDNINNAGNQYHTLSNNYFFDANQIDDSLLVHQYQNNKNKSTGLGSSFNYSEPMSENAYLNFSYNYNYGINNSIRDVFDYNPVTSNYDQYIDSLSSRYSNNNVNSAAAINYNYSTPGKGFGIGIRWLTSTVKSNQVGKDNIYQQSFSGFAPNISFFSNGKRDKFNIYYNFNLQAPQASQLQPVIDNTNPLYVRLGNPDLKYAMVHFIKYKFNYYNPKKEIGFNSNASFSSIINNIASSTISDINTGSQVTKPINTSGAYSWDAWFSFFSPIYLGKDKVKWNINLYANGKKNINLMNNEEDVSLGNYAKLNLGLTYDTPKWIDLHTNFSFSMQESDYSLQPNMSSTAYFLDVSPYITFSPTPKTEINIDYDYRQTSGQAAGFNSSVNMLNTDIVQYLTAKKDVWIKLKAYDLLNQNVSLWRSTGDNYIQDTRANVLSRFVMLSINFKLNKFNTRHEDMDMPEVPKDDTL
jgi:hypothetical protein